MLNFCIKIFLIPFVYLLLFLRSFVKWFIVVPVLFTLFFIKNAFIWLIVGIVAAFIATPITTVVVLVIALFFVFSKTKENVSDSMPMFFFGGWNYKTKVMREMELYKEEKKRVKYEKKILKAYAKIEDEFIGFNQIADVFVNWGK